MVLDEALQQVERKKANYLQGVKDDASKRH